MVFRWFSGALVVCGIGCGDAVVPIAGTGSTGVDADTTGGPSTPTSDTSTDTGVGDHGTSLEPETSSTSSGGLADSSESSDTEVTQSGTARFLVTRTLERGPSELSLFTYADGSLTSTLLETAPAGASLGPVRVANEGTLLTYCIRGAAVDDDCSAIDLSEPAPGPIQSLVTGSVPQTYITLDIDVLDEDRVLLRAIEEDQNSFHVVPVDGGSVGDAQAVITSSTSSLSPVVAPDASFLIARVDDGMGGRNLVRASIDAPDPDDVETVVEQPADQASPISRVDILPGGNALLFDVDSTNFAGGEALYFASIDDDATQAPLRLDDPDLREPGDLVFGPNVAPDGHALLYFLSEAIYGDMVYVDLSSGVPGPSVLAWDGENGEGAFFRNAWWSPDSRWVVFDVDDDEAGTSLYAIDTADPTLEPSLVAGPYAGGNTLTFAFDPDGAWIYFTAALDIQGAQLFRVPMSDDGPGDPERLSNGQGALPGEFIPSPDWSSALYTDDTARGPRLLFESELTARRIQSPMQINGELARGETVSFGARYSHSGTVVLFRQQPGDVVDPTRLYLRDRVSDAIVEIADEALVTGVLRELD